MRSSKSYVTFLASHLLITHDADSAEPTASKKKKHLTDSELALRREETARKRKNLSEKKLEDEKAGREGFTTQIIID